MDQVPLTSAAMLRPCARCGIPHPAGAHCPRLAMPMAASAAGGLAAETVLAGRYRILRPLHAGGMSMVYLAEDRVTEMQVAVKELRIQAGASVDDAREAEAWFAREAALLGVLHSPLMPRFHGAFHEGNHSYIVQEYIEGENLEELVARSGPLPEQQVMDWAQSICGLLNYLHEQSEPIIYRDIKPANIILRAGDRRPAVVDFGIACPYRLGEVQTVVGTPGYAPPEQYQGLATPRSDIYALGATMHRLLTAYNPEQGAPFTFPPVAALNPAVSQELARIVEHAVQLNPADRFPSAEALGAMLGYLQISRSPGADSALDRPPRSLIGFSRAPAWLSKPTATELERVRAMYGVDTSPGPGPYPIDTEMQAAWSVVRQAAVESDAPLMQSVRPGRSMLAWRGGRLGIAPPIVMIVVLLPVLLVILVALLHL